LRNKRGTSTYDCLFTFIDRDFFLSNWVKIVTLKQSASRPWRNAKLRLVYHFLKIFL
jgi:hypothetical protein